MTVQIGRAKREHLRPHKYASQATRNPQVVVCPPLLQSFSYLSSRL